MLTFAAEIFGPPCVTWAAVAKAVPMPAGYALSWSGQFEYLERATAKLKVVVPFTLLIIFVLLYLVFGRLDEAMLIMGTLPWP
jgi:Cu(I)/Ag(I) efflux system membrane protein CusA/SilA